MYKRFKINIKNIFISKTDLINKFKLNFFKLKFTFKKVNKNKVGNKANIQKPSRGSGLLSNKKPNIENNKKNT